MQQSATDALNTILEILPSHHPANDGLLGGRLGLCYLYYQLYQATGDTAYQMRGRDILVSIFEKINTGEPGIMGTSLSSGCAGLGFVVNDLTRKDVLGIHLDPSFFAMDDFLFQSAMEQIDKDYMDYLHGAFGILHYFSEKTRCKKSMIYLDGLVEKICTKIVKDKGGYWFRNRVLRPEELEEINFSLSHGLTGMLLILLNTYNRTKHKALVKETVEQGIRFIQKHRLWVDYTEGEYSFFPFTVTINAREIENHPRLAWCYGDLNEVLLFYRAGKMFKDQAIADEADKVGFWSLMRKDEASTQVRDSHFCHGASGLAQFYRVLFQESGREKYREGYEYWIQQTLSMLQQDIQNERYKDREHGLLDGLAGVALTLLSYATEKNLDWSRVLLL